MSDLHEIASLNEKAIRNGERVDDRDAETEPSISLDLDLGDVLAVGDVSDVGRPKYLQHPLVAGPKRHVGIDMKVVVDNEEAHRASADLTLGVDLEVGMVPIGSARMVFGDVPRVVKTFTRVNRTSNIIGVSGAHNMKAVGVKVGADGGEVAEGEPILLSRGEADRGPIVGLAVVAGEGVSELISVLAEVEGAAEVHSSPSASQGGPVE